MANRSILPRYYNYKPLAPFHWKEEPLIRMAFIVLAFAILFTFYFHNLVLIGLILYLIAIALPIAPIFNYMARRDAHVGRPSDADVDSILFDDFENVVKKRAIQRLGIKPEELPRAKILLVPGPIYWKGSGLSDSAVFRASGRDGAYRYTAWEIMVLALMDKYISIYECTYNWYSNSIVDERISEFFYNDIIAVKTQNVERERELIGGGKITKVQAFRLLTLSGDWVEVEVNKSALSPQPRIGEFTEKAIVEIRNMLREKKYREVDLEIIRNEERRNAQNATPPPPQNNLREFDGTV